MKKFLLTFLILFLSFGSGSFAADNNRNPFNREETQIRQMLNEMNKFSNEHNFKKIKTFYAKDFVSFDGFSGENYFDMIESTFKTYPDIKFTSKIKSINVDGNWATVNISDYSKATVSLLAQNIENSVNTIGEPLKGIMTSKSDYVLYLKKTNEDWEIYTDNVINEETSIKYGSADKIDIELLNPLVVKENEPYCVKLSVRLPKKSLVEKYKEKFSLKPIEKYFVLGSLSKENIVYPPTKPKDVFRQVPSSGILERMVHSNKIGVNEYTIASVGVTKISLFNNKKADIKMDGIALLMKRVNVYDKKNAINTGKSAKETPETTL